MNRQILKFNPELARNFKLELTSQRMILMPIILVLLTGLMLSFYNDGSNNSNGRNAYDDLCNYALIGFLLIAGIWGAKSAADGILDEYNSKTWDWQRMSTISPMKMTIGKLFGSTSYNWYGGIICLLIYIFAAIQSNFHSPLSVLISMVNVILSAIALQGITMLAALMQIRKGDGRKKIKSTSAIFLAFISLNLVANGFTESSWGFFTGSNNFYWYKINLGIFGTLLKPIFFSSWIIAGLYRSFRIEFQYVNGLKWWVTFLISLAIFIAGFFIRPNSLNLDPSIIAAIVFATIFAAYLIITWVLTMAEPKEFIPLKAALISWENKRYDKFHTQAPLWLVSLIFAAIFSIITAIAFSICGSGEAQQTTNEAYNGYSDFMVQLAFDVMKNNISAYVWVPIAAFFFLLRDIALILLVNLTGKRKRADGTALLLLVVLYVIAPLLVRDSNWEWLFFPVNTAGSVLMVLTPLIQASILIYYVMVMWKKTEEKNTESLA
jgi:hypothetical protein